MSVDTQYQESPSKSRTVSSKQKNQNTRKVLLPTKANAQKTRPSSFLAEDHSALAASTNFYDSPSENAPTTPKHRVKVGGRALLTPRTDRHPVTPTSRSQTVYSAARQLFAQGSAPDKLIGRDQERNQLRAFISDAIKNKSGGCLYISGPPGTGKSALVEEVLHKVPLGRDLQISTVNCVGFQAAKEVFSKLLRDFSSPNTSVNKSEKSLASLFTSNKHLEKRYVVLLDEIDHLLNSDLEALYSLFDWSLHPTSHLTLIGVANALDLTDRFLPRLKARNLKPQVLAFRPYTALQISSIITSRLQSLLPPNSASSSGYTPFLHPVAIDFCSKKVAQSGDLRKAFNIVRRAIDVIERETIEKEAQTITHQQSNPLTPPKSSPLKSSTPSSTTTTPSKPIPRSSALLSHLTPMNAPRATISHLARITSSIFTTGSTSARLSVLNLQQKAVLCSLIATERQRARCVAKPFETSTKANNLLPSVGKLFVAYDDLCRRDNTLQPLTKTEFGDVVGSLETLGLVSNRSGRVSGSGRPTVTPSKTPGRKRGVGVAGDAGSGNAGAGVGAGAPGDKWVVCAVSESEMESELGRGGPGSEILRGLLQGQEF